MSWTFEMSMNDSLSTMPPPRLACGFAFWWRLIIPMPSMRTFPLPGSTSSTRPRLPLSRPAMTATWSFFRIFERFVPAMSLNHLRRERNDLHEVLVAQFAGHWSKDASADRRSVFFDQDGGVLVEPHVRSVGAAHFLARAHDHGVLHRALFD